MQDNFTREMNRLRNGMSPTWSSGGAAFAATVHAHNAETERRARVARNQTAAPAPPSAPIGAVPGAVASSGSGLLADRQAAMHEILRCERALGELRGLVDRLNARESTSDPLAGRVDLSQDFVLTVRARASVAAQSLLIGSWPRSDRWEEIGFFYLAANRDIEARFDKLNAERTKLNWVRAHLIDRFFLEQAFASEAAAQKAKAREAMRKVASPRRARWVAIGTITALVALAGLVTATGG